MDFWQNQRHVISRYVVFQEEGQQEHRAKQ
jgi:hypothetical protein